MSGIARRALLLGLALLGGCALPPAQQAFAPVQKAVAERGGHALEWRRQADEDTRTAAAVRAMLAEPLTPDQAVRIALVNSPRLQARFESLGIAQADLVQVGLLQNPVLSLERLESGPDVERSFGLAQELLSLFTLAARKQIAAQHLHRVQLEIASQVLGLVSEVKAAYFTLQGNEQALQLLESADSAGQAAAQLTQAQRDVGTANALQVAQQQVIAGQTALDLARAQAQVRGDREKLNRLLGLWGSDVAWQLPRQLPQAPAQLPQLNGLEERAIAQRLDLAAAKRELDALNSTLHLRRNTRWLGGLELEYSRTRETDDALLRGPGVELEVPVFDRGQGRIGRAQAELRRAERQLAQMAIDIRAQVRAAHDRLLATHAQLQHLRERILPQHEVVVAQTQLRVNGMLTDIYQLLLAKQRQLAAAREHVAAARDFWLAHAELESALGSKLAELGAAQSAPDSSVAPPPMQEPHHHHHQR